MHASLGLLPGWNLPAGLPATDGGDGEAPPRPPPSSSHAEALSLARAAMRQRSGPGAAEADRRLEAAAERREALERLQRLEDGVGAAMAGLLSGAEG